MKNQKKNKRTNEKNKKEQKVKQKPKLEFAPCEGDPMISEKESIL